MQTVSCPGCGAPVEFRSHASVLAVCAYCHSTILKDAETVKDLGKMSDVLEDYSPLQIGTSGVHRGQPFTLIGRIQLRYEAGMWNEWHLLYDDGATAWLGDSSGLYTITAERKPDPNAPLPAFAQLRPGQVETLLGESYTVAEVRSAECIAGQGELPFKVGAGWRIQVADLRNKAAFLTLDYSDGVRPAVYTGLAVTLDQLDCQLLRDDDQIKGSAGKFRGKVGSLDCPSCGAAIAYVPGAAAQLVCPACHAQLDASGPEAQVLAIGKRIEAVSTTLELGAQASIKNKPYQVIGLMRRADDEGGEWNEYLLHNPRAGFLWLVETDDGWSRSTVLADWPSWTSTASDTVAIGEQRYAKLYDYGAQVLFAAGAFNWRVAVGDTARVHEFKKGQSLLAAEITEHEMTWSRSTPVATDQMAAWFGPAFRGAARPSRSSNRRGVAKIFIIITLVLNAIPLFFSFSTTLTFSVLACMALFLPAAYLDMNDQA